MPKPSPRELLGRLCKLTRLHIALLSRRTELLLSASDEEEALSHLADALDLMAIIGMRNDELAH